MAKYNNYRWVTQGNQYQLVIEQAQAGDDEWASGTMADDMGGYQDMNNGNSWDRGAIYKPAVLARQSCF